MTAAGPAAYAEVVSAVLDARESPASERFDAVLAEAVAAGAIDPALARVLRSWQRASVREVSDHARAVLPGVLALLTAAAEDARAASRSAEQWAGGADVPRQPDTDAVVTLPQQPEPANADPDPDPVAQRRRLVVAGLTSAG